MNNRAQWSLVILSGFSSIFTHSLSSGLPLHFIDLYTMLDKLPTEIVSQILINYCTQQDQYHLMLTCKSTYHATNEHYHSHFKPQPNLICWDNPVHHDYHYKHLQNVWRFKKSQHCSTNNYFEHKGRYRILSDEWTSEKSKL